MLCSTSESVGKMSLYAARLFLWACQYWKEMRGGGSDGASTILSQLRCRLLCNYSCNQKSIKWFFSIQGHSLCPSRLLLSSSSSAVGRVCRYAQTAIAEVKVREQSHNLKILPALPLLSLCHCCCASPVTPCLQLSSLSSFSVSSTPPLCCPPLSNSFQTVFTRKYKGQQ